MLIAANVFITDHDHGTDPLKGPYARQPLRIKTTRIGNNVWIGEKCILLKGSVVGDFSIIGAGSVVSGEIPSYSIAAGNPARVIKKYDFETNRWQTCNAPVKKQKHGCSDTV